MLDLNGAHAVLFDFDGTLADTSGRVEMACAAALDAIFGGPDVLDQIGGFGNKSPGEMVSLAMTLFPNAICGRSVDEMTSEFVRAKLLILMDQVSIEWPIPYPGVCDFFAHLRSKNILGLDNFRSSFQRCFS